MSVLHLNVQEFMNSKRLNGIFNQIRLTLSPRASVTEQTNPVSTVTANKLYACIKLYTLKWDRFLAKGNTDYVEGQSTCKVRMSYGGDHSLVNNVIGETVFTEGGHYSPVNNIH